MGKCTVAPGETFCLHLQLTCAQHGRQVRKPKAGNKMFPRGRWCNVQNVTTLGLQQNIFEGQLPMDWAQAGRWPSLTSLQLWNNSLSGAIPATWSNATALPALKYL